MIASSLNFFAHFLGGEQTTSSTIMLLFTLHGTTVDGVEVVIWLFSSNTGTISVSSSILSEQSTDRDKDGDSDSLRLLQLSSILTSTAMSWSSIMEVDFSKENVAVVNNAVDTEISVFLQNSDELIANHNLQGTSSLPQRCIFYYQ